MHHRTLLFTFVAVLVLPGCKDANTKMCLEEFAQFEKAIEAEDNKAQEMAGGIYQSCGISCDITEDKDACAAFKKVTEVICEKEGKEACEKLCNAGDKNEHACAALAAMQ